MRMWGKGKCEKKSGDESIFSHFASFVREDVAFIFLRQCASVPPEFCSTHCHLPFIPLSLAPFILAFNPAVPVPAKMASLRGGLQPHLSTFQFLEVSLRRQEYHGPRH